MEDNPNVIIIIWVRKLRKVLLEWLSILNVPHLLKATCARYKLQGARVIIDLKSKQILSHNNSLSFDDTPILTQPEMKVQLVYAYLRTSVLRCMELCAQFKCYSKGKQGHGVYNLTTWFFSNPIPSHHKKFSPVVMFTCWEVRQVDTIYSVRWFLVGWALLIFFYT